MALEATTETSTQITPTIVSTPPGQALIGATPPSGRKLSVVETPTTTPEVDKPGDKILSLDDPESVFDDSGETITTKSNENKTTIKPSSTESKSKSDSTDDKSSSSEGDKEEVEKEEPGFDLGIDEPKTKPDPTKARDYTGLKQEYVDVLKHVPNRLYEKARELLIRSDKLEEENKKIKSDYEAIKSNKLPDTYYEHEKAYLLHPEYETALREANMLEFEEQHWMSQLRNIKQGKDWRELVGYHKDSGEPAFKEHKAIGEGKIDVDAELMVGRFLNSTVNMKPQISKKLEEISGEFKSKHNSTVAALEEIDNKYFSKMKDIAALPKEAQDIYNQTVSVLKSKLPGLNQKVVELFAKSYLSNLYKTQELQKRDAKIKQLSEKQDDTLRAGPTSKTLNGAGGKVVADREYNTKDIEQDWS